MTSRPIVMRERKIVASYNRPRSSDGYRRVTSWDCRGRHWTLFPAVGVDILLPYALKNFGFACEDPRHPAREDVAHNIEREWAWSLGNASINEVSINGRVFVQPPRRVGVSWQGRSRDS